MRGKVAAVQKRVNQLRITPAYAGKRRLVQSVYIVYGDHPRLCGEKLFMDGEYGARIGSPPPMRGKVTLDDFSHEQLRITPAYAGKRVTFMFTLKIEKDHPRLCGEKAIFSCSVNPNVGSPPPMRGKAHL